MHGDLDKRLENLAKKFHERQREAAQIQEQLAELRVVGRSPDNLVEVTVGPAGQLLGLKINPRAMTDSARLAAKILKAAQTATAQASQRTEELVKPLRDALPFQPDRD